VLRSAAARTLAYALLVADAAAAGFISLRVLAALAIVLLPVAAFLGIRHLFALTFSFTFGTIVAIAGFAPFGSAVDRRIAYRPFDLLAAHDQSCGCYHYKPNAAVDGFEMPYGDLVPLARGRRLAVDLQPRRISYRTDNLGLRNDAAYAGEPWILAGDSFAAGDDNDQKDTPVAQLRAAGLRVYSVAFSGAPPDYARLFDYFRARTGAADHRVVVLLYEGNDFGDPFAQAAGRGDALRRARSFVTGTTYYRFTFSLWNRLIVDLSPARDDPASGVLVHTIGGHRVGFLQAYADQTSAAEQNVDEDAAKLARTFERFGDRLAAAFVVPTKYRVYYPRISPGAAPLPRRAWRITQRACDAVGIRCEDLSDAMGRDADAALAARGDLLYWTDDTHWNRLGIASAIARIGSVMKK
jgi:hypothetical protein